VAQPTPAPAARQLAHFRVDRTAYVRDAPQPTARLLGSASADSADATQIEVLSRVPGPAPEDATLLPEEQAPLWYQIVWPPGSDAAGYVHCSSIALDAGNSPSCAPLP
jgi:hypothetical protein